jgi:hypothetical protein
MKYFSSLPLLTQTDSNGNSYLLRNLLVRTELIPQLSKNPLLFYKYELREGDTPEIVANKYYGDSYRYWIVMYGNPGVMDPQADWPLTSSQFLLYLKDKYETAAGGAGNVMSYVLGTVHHYEKVVTTYEDDTQTTIIKNVEIDADTYNSLQTTTTTNTFSTGAKVTMTISGKAVSIYDYENDANEAKRSINLINSAYVNQAETQYQKLTSA